MGVPLVKSNAGEPLGILCAVSLHKLNLPKRIKEVFNVIAARVSAEIERKRNEEKLVESERKYKQLVEDIGPGSLIFSHLEDGTLTYVSPSVKGAVGIEKEVVIGKRWQDILIWVPESFALAVNENQELVSGKENSNYEVSFFDNEGSFRTLHIQSHLIYDPQKKIRKIEGLATDITAKKKTKPKRKSSLKTFRLPLRM